MARKTTPASSEHTLLLSAVMLALWRWRQSWYLLLITGLGIAATVMIVCALPLFSQITATAGLRSTLSMSPDASEILLDSTTQGLSTRLVQDMQRQFQPLFQQPLKGYLSPQEQFSIQIPGLTIIAPAPPQAGDQMQLVGASMAQAAAHIILVQGRLPRADASEIEIALTPASARSLHVTVGSVVTLQLSFLLHPNTPAITRNVAMHVTGIFTSASDTEPFWHGTTFQPIQAGPWTTYTALIPDETLLAQADAFAQESHLQAIFTLQSYDIRWYNYLDPARISINQLDDLSNRLASVQADIANRYGYLQSDEQATQQYPYLQKVTVSGALLNTPDGLGLLEQYRSRLALVRVPIVILTLQVMALILIFVSMMAEQLVDRQLDAIALLRSRGASDRQIFGSLIIQSVVLSAGSLLIAPPLAVLAIDLITRNLLSVADQTALRTITSEPLFVMQSIAWYAIAAVLAALLALLVAFSRASRLDMFTLRRESTGPTRRALWQRLHLDIVAMLLALAGYALSLYITILDGLLNTQTRELVVAPLALVAPVFLLIACTLLFLRLFPYVLQLGALFAARGRGAASMLALAQMARAPRQALRMTMLLALATAFALFALVFGASQAQHASDLAAYQAGADFSGDIPAVRVAGQGRDALRQTSGIYQRISGVSAVSAGMVTTGIATGTAPVVNIHLEAVDPPSFAQAAAWPQQTSVQPLHELLTQLVVARGDGIRNKTLPVIVDDVLVRTLDLRTGSTFTITINRRDALASGNVQCIVVGNIDHLPTVIDSIEPREIGNGGGSLQSGLLTDYQSMSALYSQGALPVNHIWLRTQDDSAALSRVRVALAMPTLHLDNLMDRRALLKGMQADPLYLNLIGVLTLGAITALLLAFVGSILASWLNAHTRQTSFAVLRALGTTPVQAASVLTWEQTIIYLIAIVLGLLFGALLSVTVVPALTFASVSLSTTANASNTTTFYALQHILPTQIVLPFSLSIAFMTFVVLCIVALVVMVRVVMQPAMIQSLYFNED